LTFVRQFAPRPSAVDLGRQDFLTGEVLDLADTGGIARMGLRDAGAERLKTL
jgi:hypothetical protein